MAKEHHNFSVAPATYAGILGSTAPGMDPELADRLLRTYFSGRRRSVRTNCLLPLQIEGSRGSFQALALDTSRAGILLRITDLRFAPEEERRQLMPYAARVWFHFERGMRVRFPGTEVETTADVVRVTSYTSRFAGLILLGCRFRRELTEQECARLGVEYAEDRAPHTN